MPLREKPKHVAEPCSRIDHHELNSTRCEQPGSSASAAPERSGARADGQVGGLEFNPGENSLLGASAAKIFTA